MVAQTAGSIPMTNPPTLADLMADPGELIVSCLEDLVSFAGRQR